MSLGILLSHREEKSEMKDVKAVLLWLGRSRCWMKAIGGILVGEISAEIRLCPISSLELSDTATLAKRHCVAFRIDPSCSSNNYRSFSHKEINHLPHT